MMPRARMPVALLTLLLASLTFVGAPRAQTECAARFPADRISVDLRNADVQTTLRLMSQQYRVNVVVTNDVAGTVTVSFYDVPVRDIFQALLDSTNLRCFERFGVLRVTTASRAQAELESRAKTEESERKAAEDARKAEIERRRSRAETERDERAVSELQALGTIREDTIQLSYADALEVADTLQGMLGFEVGPGGGGGGRRESRGRTFCEIDSGGSEASAPTALPPVNIPGLPQVPSLPGVPTAPPSTVVVPATVARENVGQSLTIRGHRPTNTIFIRHFEVVIERIKRIVRERFDVPSPQVQIAAQMVITSQTALEQLGIQWGGTIVDQRRGGPTLLGSGGATPNLGGGIGPARSEFTPTNSNLTLTEALPVSATTGLPVGGNLVNLPLSQLPTATANPALGLLFGIIGSQFNINLAIQALETEGKARSIAEPKVVTLENQCAVISRGFEVPFVSQSGFGGTQVQFKEALLKLEVLPSVLREDGRFTGIKMRVLIDNNEPDFSRAVAGNPPIFRRRAGTEVVIREGERLIIGGVMLETDNAGVRQVPVLGRIPILGWLFKSRETSVDRQELIVILTPTVIPPAAGVVKR